MSVFSFESAELIIKPRSLVSCFAGKMVCVNPFACRLLYAHLIFVPQIKSRVVHMQTVSACKLSSNKQGGKLPRANISKILLNLGHG